ncbi:MAG: zf-HC2 domain-containing protein [Clostridium sartagoforme]|nr:zf-HC2 domain-containing protein [Clostridium sartagoforme]
MKERVSCGIIKDLLPNYVENVLSNEGNELVKDHLNSCSSCRKEYEVINSTIDINNIEKVKVNYFKKVNIRFLIILISLFVVTLTSIILLTFYTEVNTKESILTLIFLTFITIAIIVKFIVPLIGLVFSIVYLRSTHKKVLIVPLIIFGIWLLSSVYIYIRNLI